MLVPSRFCATQLIGFTGGFSARKNPVKQRTGFYKAKSRSAFASFIRTCGEGLFAKLPSATDFDRFGHD